MGHLQRATVNLFVRLAKPEIAGTEERRKKSGQIECCNAMFVELERLIVERRYKILFRPRHFSQNGERLRQRLRAIEYEFLEIIWRERALVIKHGASHIFG